MMTKTSRIDAARLAVAIGLSALLAGAQARPIDAMSANTVGGIVKVEGGISGAQGSAYLSLNGRAIVGSDQDAYLSIQQKFHISLGDVLLVSGGNGGNSVDTSDLFLLTVGQDGRAAVVLLPNGELMTADDADSGVQVKQDGDRLTFTMKDSIPVKPVIHRYVFAAGTLAEPSTKPSPASSVRPPKTSFDYSYLCETTLGAGQPIKETYEFSQTGGFRGSDGNSNERSR